MNDLPYEIWQHIISFLDKDVVQELYPVNKILFDIAMNERYASTWIGCGGLTMTRKSLLEIPNPEIALSRLRTLSIRRGGFIARSPAEPRTLFRSLLRRVNKEENNSSIPDDPYEKIMQLMPKMASITKLDLDMTSVDDAAFYPTKLLILDLGWSTFGANLKSLALIVPLQDLARVLFRHLHLPRLENFSMKIFASYTTSDVNTLAHQILLPFFQSHQSTLASLVLRCHTDVDLSSLLLHVPYMPSLVDITIIHTFVSFLETKLTGHAKFLLAHRDNLRRLSIVFMSARGWYPDFPPPSEWYAQEWCRIHFPKLESSYLDFSHSEAEYSNGAVEYFRRQHTLQSLKLQGLPMSYTDIDRLLEPVGSSVAFSRLRHLELVLAPLTPAIIQLLADRLPDLHSLSLDPAIGRMPSHGITLQHPHTMGGFHDGLKDLHVENWKLYSLEFKTCTIMIEIHAEVKFALISALPNLKYLCGSPRAECLDGASAAKASPKR